MAPIIQNQHRIEPPPPTDFKSLTNPIMLTTIQEKQVKYQKGNKENFETDIHLSNTMCHNILEKMTINSAGNIYTAIYTMSGIEQISANRKHNYGIIF